jgi:hypothetical protein
MRTRKFYVLFLLLTLAFMAFITAYKPVNWPIKRRLTRHVNTRILPGSKL